MRISFRLTMLSVLLLMVSTTVLLIGFIFYRQARFTADDLARQLLEQTAARVELQTSALLNQATRLNTATEERLRAERLRSDDFEEIVNYLRDALVISDKVSGFFVGLEQTGEATGVTRISGKPIVWQSNRNSEGTGYIVNEFLLQNYPRLPLFNPGINGPDIRGRPWYDQVRRSGRPIWTDSYVLIGAEGVRDSLGVTYASPFQREGKLVAVLDADFELQQLCRFLASIKFSQSGIAFIIERRQDGSQRVVAHPSASLLTRANPGSPRSLLSPVEFSDPRVSTFANLEAMSRAEGRGGAVSIRLSVAGEPYLGTVRPLSGENLPDWSICVVLPEREVLGRVNQSLHQTLWIGVAVLAASVLVSLYLAAQVSKPLERIAQDAIAVGQLQLAPHPVVRSIVREVDRLGIAMEDMKAGIRSFRKFIPTDLVRAYLSSGSEAKFGGMRRTVTIFFSDIVDFTTIAEDLSPEELVELLREYLNAMTREIEAAGGTVDKYIGDAIMAFWGAPSDDPAHAFSACATALRCQEVLRMLNGSWAASGKPIFRTRIGLHTGEVIVGNIGSDTRLNYTAIGDAVNLASRLEALNKHYGSAILVSDTTYQQISNHVVARPIDYVGVKGRRVPVVVYEVLSLSSDNIHIHRVISQVFGKVLDLYRRSEFAGAITLLEGVVRDRPDDAPASVLLERCRFYMEHPPEPGWDGVYRRNQK